MEHLDVKKLKDLLNTVKKDTEENDDKPALFSDVPVKLRDFIHSANSALLEVKAKIGIDKLKARSAKQVDPKERIDSLDENKKHDSLPHAINWIVTMLKHMYEKINDHGDILTLHTKVLSDPNAALTDPKDEVIEKLQNEVEELKTEVDETRQRGLKGNLIVSSPQRGNIASKAVHKNIPDPATGDERPEDDTEMVTRLIKEKTGVQFNPNEVLACHPLGKREKNTFILRIANKKPGSNWDTLTSGMKKGTNFKPEVNVFINYQLTKRRADLAKKVREAKSGGKIEKYSVDQNGKFKVKTKNPADKEWPVVKTVDDLNKIIDK